MEKESFSSWKNKKWGRDGNVKFFPGYKNSFKKFRTNSEKVQKKVHMSCFFHGKLSRVRLRITADKKIKTTKAGFLNTQTKQYPQLLGCIVQVFFCRFYHGIHHHFKNHDLGEDVCWTFFQASNSCKSKIRMTHLEFCFRWFFAEITNSWTSKNDPQTGLPAIPNAEEGQDGRGPNRHSGPKPGGWQDLTSKIVIAAMDSRGLYRRSSMAYLWPNTEPASQRKAKGLAVGKDAP